MSFRTVHLGMIIHDAPPPLAVADYALAFCEGERAHLTAHVATPVIGWPGAQILPLLHAAIEQMNARRLERAEAERQRIEASALLLGITADCHVSQKPFAAIRSEFVAAARLSDLVILPRPAGILSSEQGLVEDVLFGSGRPVLVVPAEWTRGPIFDRIVVAWDGGQQAARAIGDAMPLLQRAKEVEIVCVSSDADKSAAGADLAQYLARQCSALKLTELPTVFADAGMTLRNHLATVTPDLMVMGAFAHSRFREFVLGGVTSTMLSEAKVPVFYAH